MDRRGKEGRKELIDRGILNKCRGRGEEGGGGEDGASGGERGRC